MRNIFSERLTSVRQKAIVEAEEALRTRGFVPTERAEWQGFLDGGRLGIFIVAVHLPAAFPDVLPEVYIEPSVLDRKIPNIETNGKICLASNTGLLIDAANPRGIIVETLERARKVLVNGYSRTNDDRFKDEFLAYWNTDTTFLVSSTCCPKGSSRPVQQVWLKRPNNKKLTKILIAEDIEAAKIWAEKTGWIISKKEPAFFVSFTQEFVPTKLFEQLTSNEILDVIQTFATPDTYQDLKSWLSKVRLPITIIMSLPLKSDQGYALIAVQLKRASGEARRQAQRGFRPDKVPAIRELSYSGNTPVDKLFVERLDAEYLLTRGGALNPLYGRIVVVVGCGAIGSHIVERLASLGVGNLRLIDPEILMSENAHRHVLGVNWVGLNKAHAMKLFLNRRFPHLIVEHQEACIEAVLREIPEFVTSADAIVIAVGDETLELRLNDLLRGSIPRLHVWVEPLGVGGHVLATGVTTGSGCFRCLFNVDPNYGLFNQAAFAEPGQEFQKSFAGCAGTFTPFAGIDADRAAIEAATLALRILNGEETENVLISWKGYDTTFTKAGFRLSNRGKMFKANEWRRETEHATSNCSACCEM